MSLKFELGEIHVTSGLKDYIESMFEQGYNVDLMTYLTRHVELLDFGNLQEEDKERNLEMINNNIKYGMVLSSYCLPNGKEIWLITYIDHYSVFLFPEEY